MFQTRQEEKAARLQQRGDTLGDQLHLLEKQPADQRSPAARTSILDLTERIDKLRDDGRDAGDKLGTIQRIFYIIKTPLPKTDETIKLTERVLISLADLPEVMGGESSPAPATNQPFDPVDQQRAAVSVVRKMRERSVAWVLGTSLGFELVVLAAGAWLFSRRDF